MTTSIDVDDILSQVSKYLRDQLAKECLSNDAEKSRKQLLEQLDKYFREKDPYKAVRPTKLGRLSCEVKNLNDDVSSKRESKCSESKGGNIYETNFTFVKGDQTDSCDESDYESMEDRQSLASDQSDRKLDSKRHSKRMSKMKNESEFVNRSYEGYLYKKGKLNSWRKLYSIIYDKWLVCYTKDSKQLHRIKLEGYEASHQRSKDNNKYEHELRLTGPGLKSYTFYAKDKVGADLWVIELTKTIDKAKSNSLPASSASNNNVNKDEPENLSTNSYCPVEAPPSDQSYTNPSKPSKFHNLINKVKQKAMAAFDSLDSSHDKNVSGLLNVTFDDLSKAAWVQKFCIIKSKHLEVYRNHGNEKVELSLPLQGMGLTLIPSSEYFVLCLNQSGQKIFIKFNNHPELNKWYQSLQRESMALPEVPHGLGPSEDVSLYDEIGDSFGLARPTIPEWSPPMTPDVTGALMNMDEVGYMDALQCRQPITSTFKEKEEQVTYEEVSLYVNRGDDSMATSEDTNISRPYYCPMSRGSGSTPTGKQSKPTTKTPATNNPPASSIKSKIASTTSKPAKKDSTPTASITTTSFTDISPPQSTRISTTSTTTTSAKRASGFEEIRGKFLQPSSTSTNKNEQLTAPAPNKWVTPLVKKTSTGKFDDRSISQGGDDVDCLMRNSKANRISNRSSTPDGTKRDSESSGKSNLMQERMKIFQNI